MLTYLVSKNLSKRRRRISIHFSSPVREQTKREMPSPIEITDMSVRLPKTFQKVAGRWLWISLY